MFNRSLWLVSDLLHICIIALYSEAHVDGCLKADKSRVTSMSFFLRITPGRNRIFTTWEHSSRSLFLSRVTDWSAATEIISHKKFVKCNQPCQCMTLTRVWPVWIFQSRFCFVFKLTYFEIQSFSLFPDCDPISEAVRKLLWANSELCVNWH